MSHHSKISGLKKEDIYIWKMTQKIPEIEAGPLVPCECTVCWDSTLSLLFQGELSKFSRNLEFQDVCRATYMLNTILPGNYLLQLMSLAAVGYKDISEWL